VGQAQSSNVRKFLKLIIRSFDYVIGLEFETENVSRMLQG
jgi:hypothetical protein